MIWRYVLKSFRRRRVRTILMVLSLIIATSLIAAMSATIESMRQSTVDLLSDETGHYDLLIGRPETYPDQFIHIDEISQRILAADERLISVHARYQRNGEIAGPPALCVDETAKQRHCNHSE